MRALIGALSITAANDPEMLEQLLTTVMPDKSAQLRYLMARARVHSQLGDI